MPWRSFSRHICSSLECSSTQLLCATSFGVVQTNGLHWAVWTALFLSCLSDPFSFSLVDVLAHRGSEWRGQPAGPERICWVVETFGSCVRGTVFVVGYSRLWTCACWPHPLPRWVSLSKIRGKGAVMCLFFNTSANSGYKHPSFGP